MPDGRAYLRIGKAGLCADHAEGRDQLPRRKLHARMADGPEARGEQQKEKDVQRGGVLKPLPLKQAAIEADIAAGCLRCVAHDDLLMHECAAVRNKKRERMFVVIL